MPGYGWLTINVGDNANTMDFWEMTLVFYANVFTLDPYRQTIWWTRLIADMFNDSPTGAAFELTIAGSYYFDIGTAGVAYCESAGTEGAELFASLISGTYYTYTNAHLNSGKFAPVSG